MASGSRLETLHEHFDCVLEVPRPRDGAAPVKENFGLGPVFRGYFFISFWNF